ncbi:VOC family protein [Alicyclobacillus sp. SO9]|uniref:VOC family protein n=1 Tax=Alicyclobacillus sp. SO9 TaxID=2665646 RepID=UPI0018E72143|nr:VOC family protein [Alicyclobacillus sp. SO9]QQE77585.1 VOC family protein [Alicyclobacillus sp. SO9]
MIKVFRLGYVHFQTQNMERMLEYYTDVLGLTVTQQDSQTAYVSTSIDHHNIILEQSSESGVVGFGLQLVPEMSVAEAASELERMGLNGNVKTDPMPGVSELVEFKDIDGYTVQLFGEMELAAEGFKKTGVAPNKVGHLSLRVQDAKKSVEFYKQFGFTNTDWIEDFFGFMTCNRDHHVLNFATSDRKEMHHMALELRDYSHLIQSMDTLGRNGIRILWGPSRHGAGHNIATYHRDPDGNMIELFTDADIYVPELDMFEPRPWHENYPQKPRVWETEECMTRWGTAFEQSLV